MNKDTTNHFKKHNILFHGNNVNLSLNDKLTIIEPFVQIRTGQFDIGKIGSFTYIGGGHSTVKNVESIGRFCSLASNLSIGQFEHPTNFLSSSHMLHGNWEYRFKNLKTINDFIRKTLTQSQKAYNDKFKPNFRDIVIGNDVWIGEGVFISRGVNIGDGAIIGAKAVVTKDIPPYAIVVGTPAKVIKYRFEQEDIDELLKIQWWNYAHSVLLDVDMTDIKKAIAQIKLNISQGCELFDPKPVEVYNSDFNKNINKSVFNNLIDISKLHSNSKKNSLLKKLNNKFRNIFNT